VAILNLEVEGIAKMSTKIKNPARVKERKVQSQKIKSFNSLIVSDLQPKRKPSGYQKLINFVISGDRESAKEFIEQAGYSGILAEFLLGNAELDARLQGLAAVMPMGYGDE
jgi:hypothetical protein